MGRHSKTAQPQSVFRSRTRRVFFVTAASFFLLGGRLVYVQAVRHPYFVNEAKKYREISRIVPATRGLLLDRNKNLLAVNQPGIAVYADPVVVVDPQHTAEQLSPLIGVPVERLARLLTPKSPRNHYASLARHVPDTNGARDAIKALKLPGINMVTDTVRSYPNKTLAAQVIGFTDRDGHGAEGLEASQDATLQGRDGLQTAEVDKQGRFIPDTQSFTRTAEDGADLVLTLDRELQYAADTALGKAVKEHHAQRGVVVVMDPNTGDILALSNAPTYDPNMPRPVGPLTKDQALAVAATQRDSAASDLYEPGSTMKTITAAAVLEQLGLGKLNEHVYCSGQAQIGGHTIHCAKDPPTYGVHGDETMAGVMEQSCNIGMAHFGIELGAPALFDFEQKFGFLDRPGSGLPGEARSRLQSPAEFNRHTGRNGWPTIKLANVAFGQGVSVTPLQLATAYCAIANGGSLMQPHIVRGILREGKEPQWIGPTVVRRVLKPEVAAQVRELLRDVVLHGTGQPAQIAGFSVGGKTGSAQVYGPHGYAAGGFVASFVGMLPVAHPRAVILCAVFQPQGVHWGAAVAAPVVHEIEQHVVREMHLVPDAPDLLDWSENQRRKRSGGRHTAPVLDLGNGVEEL